MTQHIDSAIKTGELLTIRELYGPTTEVTNQAAADDYFAALLRYMTHHNTEKTEEENISILKQNIGYYAGYCSHETRLRVEQLFTCTHPVFGAATNGEPTPEEAFNLGVERGRALKEQRNDHDER